MDGEGDIARRSTTSGVQSCGRCGTRELMSGKLPLGMGMYVVYICECLRKFSPIRVNRTAILTACNVAVKL